MQFSSVQSLGRLGRLGDKTDDSAEILFQSFPLEAFVSSSGMDIHVHSDFVHPAFPLPTTASPNVQGALKDDFGEAVVACDMPKTWKFPSLDSCQTRFMWTRKDLDLVPRPVVGLVLHVEDVQKFPQALGFKSLDPLFRVSK